MFPIVNGLFSLVNYSFPEEFQITPLQLDTIFISQWGMRSVAPIVAIIHESDDEQLTTVELQTLADIIRGMFFVKWNKLAAVYDIEYDPIHNYSDTYHEELSEGIEGEKTTTYNVQHSDDTIETVDRLESDGGTQTTSKATTNSNTRTDNLSETSSGTVDNGIFGFNSDEAVGSDNSASSNTRTNTGTVGNAGQGSELTTVNGGLTHSIDDSRTTQGTKQKTGTEGEEHTSDRTRTRDFTHLGNIGNQTTQQLLTEELELWRWNIINEVLNDVKEFLTLPVYD